MSRLTRKNVNRIKGIFEEKTGTKLSPKAQFPMKKLVVLAAAVAACFALAGFTYPLFTPLDKDELTLSGTYEGSGVVSVYVENKSEKDLEFQKQLKLMNWFTEEEAPKLGGEVRFSGTVFEAGTNGTMTIDLSQAYDIEYVEEDVTNPWYYLVLTNNNFLFGHDWMCSVNFGSESSVETTEPSPAENVPAENLEQIDEGLRFYFEKSYEGAPIALNDANFPYLQKVEEVRTRCPGTVVPALSPTIMVGGPSVYLDPEPMLGKLPDGVILDETVPADQQYLLALDYWTYSDAYGRLVAGAEEKAWTIHAFLPQRKGAVDGGVSLPLIFLFVYDARAASHPDNYAFIYGQLLTFGEMEQYKVLADEHYAYYDATDLIYADVDAYLDYFLSTRQDVYCDDQIRQRVHNIYDYYRNRENWAITYREMEQ